jgi:DNA repair protein RadC
MSGHVYPENLSLKQWADEDRPREKLLLKGKAALSDAELVAILLRTGTRDETVVDVAKKLLNRVGNDLNRLGKLSVEDIMHFGIKGLGETKIITLVAALELGRRRQASVPRELSKITCSRDAYDLLSPLMSDEIRDAFDLLSPLMSDEIREQFYLLLLNNANKVIAEQVLSEGGITGTVVDARLLFKQALLQNATSIVLAHNHPSGNLKPSQADIDLTRKIKDAGKLLEIKLLDHLIIADHNYYSFADEGMLV